VKNTLKNIAMTLVIALCALTLAFAGTNAPPGTFAAESVQSSKYAVQSEIVPSVSSTFTIEALDASIDVKTIKSENAVADQRTPFENNQILISRNELTAKTVISPPGSISSRFAFDINAAPDSTDKKKKTVNPNTDRIQRFVRRE
jgi:hypothetical protein